MAMTQFKADDAVDYRKASTLSVRTGLAAIVDYDDQAVAGSPHMPTGQRRILVTLYNDATAGISINDDGPVIGDSIYVAPAAGADPKWCTITKRIQVTETLAQWEVR